MLQKYWYVIGNNSGNNSIFTTPLHQNQTYQFKRNIQFTNKNENITNRNSTKTEINLKELINIKYKSE